MTPKIEVVPYNPLWPEMFNNEAPLIKQALGSNCIEIHHIGSTAVPNLSAKPVIDILVVVKDISAVDQSSASMENLDYEDKGENGTPFRRFFYKNPALRTHHVHIFEKGNPEIERHLNFRDWMRTHPHDRDAYEELKILLAKKFHDDRIAYTFGKNKFIANIDKKAGFNLPRVEFVCTDDEWKIVKHFRQKYFFDKVSISDPYTWTFNHKEHIHFALCAMADIIGYAHVQLWKDNRAALRIIVIDEPNQHKGLGSYFLTQIEKYLKQKKVATLNIQSRLEVSAFYAKHHYIEMPFNDPNNHENDPRDIELGKILN